MRSACSKTNTNVSDFDLSTVIDDSFVENAAARRVGMSH